MQRWFFLEDHKRPKYKPTPKQSTVVKEEKMTELLSQDWLFTVIAPDVGPNEKVFITGNTPELGEWDYTKIVLLENKINTNSWSISTKIPNTCDVLYRYGVVLINNETNDVLIRQWETFITPRVLKDTVLHPFVEEFGKNNGVAAVTTGWLTTQTLVQFKFLNNPLKLRHISERLIHIKVTPVKLSFDNDFMKDQESLSSEVPDNDYVTEKPSAEIVEVSTLSNNKDLCHLKPQEQFGRQYNTDDVLIVNMTVVDHKALAYLVDFYSYSSSAAAEHAPYHVGFTYVLPSMLKPSEGVLQLPVTCNVKHRPLGTINIEYLIINPMSEKLNSFDVSYAKYWSKTWTGLDVGHRGSGASFKTKTHAIRENTIASLKKAATSGADLLEFDVQLSKDLVPVIYHDFHVCISMKRKKEVGYSEMLELPVKDLTLEQLQKLKIYHLVEGRSHEAMFFDEDLEEHQPFPTLEHCLNTIQQDVGFNVELKWTMEMQDGTFELNNPFDMNIYVDKVLEVVLKKAGDRRIVFSCFNPDICTMVRYKQNKYPVMFLTVGRTKKYEPYRDPRCGSIPAAVQSAVSTDILGIVVHTEDLLRDPTQVHLATDAGLIIFCWGDDNNDKETIKRLKVLGLHAVIYDKLDQYTSKQVKESIFLAEARESQGDILQWVKQNEVTISEPSIEPPDASHSAASLRVDLEKIRHNQQLNSTATSLESIDNPMDLRDEFEENQLKRNQEIITAIDKETQLKQQVITINNAFPECSRGACKSKKPRPN